MRLLKASTRTLHEFHGSIVPPYAILSHTWGEDEVSFQDIVQANYSRKIGYRKILRCCELAASEGWEYVWADTCCIDKTSSAELSEAINSMYQWYERAKVCYVYLADLHSSHLDGTSRPEIFGRSRWFSRGWTLQELLAPSLVVFYDCEWTEVGNKWSLQYEISQATGIPFHHLCDPKSASVAAKMSWASQRETTRVEDIAYCLMGIFDVNMPLLYGEGNRAFFRLQHEILRASEDESLFAWSDITLAPDYTGILAPSPDAFKEAGSFIPVKLSPLARRPYLLTNRGLEIDLLCEVNDSFQRHDCLGHDHREQCLAFLNCAVHEGISEYVAIKLCKNELNPQDSYVRSSPEDLTIYRRHDLEKPGLGLRTTYIRTVYQLRRTARRPHRSLL